MRSATRSLPERSAARPRGESPGREPAPATEPAARTPAAARVRYRKVFACSAGDAPDEERFVTRTGAD